jgi:hypothetical protein
MFMRIVKQNVPLFYRRVDGVEIKFFGTEWRRRVILRRFSHGILKADEALYRQ